MDNLPNLLITPPPSANFMLHFFSLFISFASLSPLVNASALRMFTPSYLRLAVAGVDSGMVESHARNHGLLFLYSFFTILSLVYTAFAATHSITESTSDCWSIFCFRQSCPRCLRGRRLCNPSRQISRLCWSRALSTTLHVTRLSFKVLKS